MKPVLAIFDMAGTTVYDGDAVNHCLRSALANEGFEVDRDAINAVMGIPKPVAIRSLLIDIPGSDSLPLDDLVTKIHTDFVHIMKSHYLHSDEVREANGAMATFEKLQAAGIKVALDTGFDRETVDVILDRLNWTDSAFIDTVITASEVKRGRPYPDMVFEIMGRLGIEDASLVAKIGDTPSDLEEGTLAGCGWVIGITSGSHTKEELTHFQHTHLAENLAEVYGIFVP